MNGIVTTSPTFVTFFGDLIMSSRILSGMRPTGVGQLHLGNYFGAIRQFVDLQTTGNRCFYFVADLHALTEVDGPTDIAKNSVNVVRNYIMCGVDPTQCTLYRQSDIPAVPHIAVLLGNVVRLNVLRRCTTFKGKLQDKCDKIANDSGKGFTPLQEEEVENGFSYGLFGYPVLMAADMFAVRAEKIPVGEDQVQHVEYARDFAGTFNRLFGPTLTVPSVNVQNPIRVPGIDGTGKMGKSLGNTIDLLDDPQTIRQKVMSIPTQSEAGGPMTQGTEALFTLVELCCGPDVHRNYLQRYAAKEGKFFGEMKKALVQAICQLTEPMKERALLVSDDDVLDILAHGAQKVRPIADAVLHDMKKAMGLL